MWQYFVEIQDSDYVPAWLKSEVDYDIGRGREDFIVLAMLTVAAYSHTIISFKKNLVI